MLRTLRNCLFGACLLLSISGCVDEQQDGNTVTVTYQWWVPASVFLGGIAAGPAGWFLRSSSQRFGWSLLIFCPIALFGFAPSLLLDRVVVTDVGLSRNSGIWGMTAVQTVKFADLQTIRVTIEEHIGRRGRKESRLYVVCDLRTGGSEKIPANNDVVETALPHFVQRARDQGIPIIDLTGAGPQ